MEKIFLGLAQEMLKKCIKKPQPLFVAPMLATLTNNYFSQEDWLYEHKFDGVRCIAHKKNGKVSLYSRNENLLNTQYPEIVAALTKQKADNFIIDGEIVAVDKKGVSDFQLLQSRMNLQKITAQETPVMYCIFDLMYVASYDIQQVPLLERKMLLKKLLRFTPLLSYTHHMLKEGIKLFKHACKSKWEGVIAKQIKSTYANKRSPNWLKFKCIMQQELVIGGYTLPRGSRSNFGALLVGYYKDGHLHYAGKVGTGFNEETLEMLGKKLKQLTVARCPFANYDGKEVAVVWVKPVLVAEFQFAQWTKGGKLRVGRYKGLRTDKNAKLVVKEVPKSIGPHT